MNQGSTSRDTTQGFHQNQQQPSQQQTQHQQQLLAQEAYPELRVVESLHLKQQMQQRCRRHSLQ
jgi:hypothetical protein